MKEDTKVSKGVQDPKMILKSYTLLKEARKRELQQSIKYFKKIQRNYCADSELLPIWKVSTKKADSDVSLARTK